MGIQYLINSGRDGDPEYWLDLNNGTTDERVDAFRYPRNRFRINADSRIFVLDDKGQDFALVNPFEIEVAPESIKDTFLYEEMLCLLDVDSFRQLSQAVVKQRAAKVGKEQLEAAAKSVGRSPEDLLKMPKLDMEKLTALMKVKQTADGDEFDAAHAQLVAEIQAREVKAREDKEMDAWLAGLDGDEDEPEPEEPEYETTVLESGQRLKHHPYEKCLPGPCPLHSPSGHALYLAPRSWGRGKMWRKCIHDVWHPDPDDLRVREIPHEKLHACCSKECCGLL